MIELHFLDISSFVGAGVFPPSDLPKKFFPSNHLQFFKGNTK